MSLLHRSLFLSRRLNILEMGGGGGGGGVGGAYWHVEEGR